ncbi:pimeloyl-ACP methyl ester carboxylesterase [Nocardia sp. GAS34]|uniref:alpha/beta fold hydrolase n=1 Tax=unclassified Nocardia TaxID=2637762 RepID=UPI003D2191B0
MRCSVVRIAATISGHSSSCGREPLAQGACRGALSADEFTDPHAVPRAVRQIRAGYPLGGADHVELVGRTDIRPLLPSVDVPTLVVAGGQDRIVLPDTVRRLASGIPGAELIEYPTAGHIFTPAETGPWVADVAAFLDRTRR